MGYRALAILEKYSDSFGCEWNSDTMLRVACDWIDDQGVDGAPDAFKEYVSRRAHADSEGNENGEGD